MALSSAQAQIINLMDCRESELVLGMIRDQRECLAGVVITS
jgi:hypothetical protein